MPLFRKNMGALWAASCALAVFPATAPAQADELTRPYSGEECPSCADWNVPREPFRIFGDTYYVGTEGLAALLVASDQGHVLIDAALPQSAPLILGNIRALGYRVEDVRVILNSHAHFDHAGGIAALQHASGAAVAASSASAPVLRSGVSGPDDPQFGALLAFPPAGPVRLFGDGDTIRVGPIALVAHLTPGHTPGGTSWSWRSCEGDRCLSLVYADSHTPVSADGFRFSRSAGYPDALADFERGFAVLERLPCDILVTPHPGASRLWDRLATSAGLVDPEACRRYAANAREQLARRVAGERGR